MRMIFIFFLFISVANAQEVHFFGSLDYARSTTKNDVEYNHITNSYSAANLDSAGMNASAKFSDKAQGLVQIIHSPVPNKMVLDLVQMQYNLLNGFKVRVGLQRLPLFLKSEVIQVKGLYPWIAPPSEVYNQNPTRSFTGGSLERAWEDFSVQLYAGSASDEFYSGSSVTSIKSENLIGLRANYTKDSFDFFANILRNKADVNFSSKSPLGSGVYGTFESRQTFRSAEAMTTGFSWNSPKKWLFISEYIHYKTPNAILKSSEAAYGSLGYHFTEKLLLLATYSKEFKRNSNYTPSLTTTYDLVLQYAVDQNTSLKLGASHVNFRRRSKPSSLFPSGSADLANGFTGAPGGNFNTYDLQLAFVF